MASTYLHSNTGTATNAKKFTLSMWIKRAKLCDSNSQRFYQGYKDGNDRVYVMFDNTGGTPDAIWIYAVTGGTVELYWTSNRRFRDTNGWYHFVFSADSTQAAQADRFKVYVNGVEETSWTKTNNPSQNIDWGNQLAQTNNTLTISGTESHTQLFDGSMSHIHFIDGTAYDASAFGSTDSTTGEWKINTSPSVTYGNNGYFILKDGNSVTDSSPNSNDFSVGAGTLTKTEDCPSNVFATFLSITNLSNVSYANGNNKMTSTSGWSWSPSTICPSKGKFYTEFKSAQGSDPIYTSFGVVPYAVWKDMNNEAIGAGANSESGSVGYGHAGNVTKGNSTQYTGSSYGYSDVVGVAVDLDNNKVYFSKNGVWQNSGDPTSGSTGTGAVSLDSTYDTWAIASSTTQSAYVNYGNGYFGTTQISSEGTNASGIGKFEYDVPTGYTALSTKGLNE